MRIGKWHFLKIGHRIIIANGKDPLRYFDLKRLKLVTYKGKGIKYDYTIK